MQRNCDHMWRIAPIMSGCLLLAAAFCMTVGADELRTLETSAVTVDRLGFDLQKVDGHAWLRLQMPLSHQIACYGELINSGGTVLGYFYADGLHDEAGGTAIAPGESSAWVDLSQFIDG